MLGNILRPRRSTATPSRTFQTSPAASQPTAPNPPSKLLGRLKGLKKFIHPGRLGKKKPDAAGHKSATEDSRLVPSEEALSTSTPTAFTGVNYDYPRAPPILPYQDFGPSVLSMNDVPRTRAASNPLSLAPPSSSRPKASSPLAPTTRASPLRQRPAPTFQNVAEIRRVQSPLAELGIFEQDLLSEEGQEIMVKISNQPKRVVLHAAPFVQSYSAEVDWCQPADGQVLPATSALEERKKRPKVEGRKWSNASQDLQQRKLYWAKRVQEYRQPQAQFCNVEGGQNQVQPEATQAQQRALYRATNTPHSPLVSEELAEQTHGVKRSQGIQRHRQLHARHPSKASQDSNMAVENEPIFRRDSLCMARGSPRWSGQGAHSTIGYDAQGPNPWSMGKSDDERSMLHAHPAQPTHETARIPLGLLNLLNGGAPVSTQAAADDDDDTDDASSSSYDYASRTSAPEPSLWLWQNGFGGGPTHF